MNLAAERREYPNVETPAPRYAEGHRYEVILDPLDQYLVWDHQTGMPAVLHGHVLCLPEDKAKGVAAMLNEGVQLTSGFIEALVADDIEEAASPAPGF